MISNNNNLIKLDWEKFIREKYSNNSQQFSTHSKIDSSNTNITSVVSTTTDNISKINLHPSTHVSYYLFSQSKSILNENNLSQQIHRSNSIDLTNHQSSAKTRNFLREDLLDEITRKTNLHSYSAINNNHFHSTSIFNSNLHLSNNKEKKNNKKEKSGEKEKKDDVDIETKKSKAKTKKIEESTIDTDSVVSSPSLITPTHGHLYSPKSPVETIGFPSLSIPVPHIGGSSTHGLISPDLSRIHTPQQSNSKFAHLSQIQHQLQTDMENPSLNKITYPQSMSKEQQLQSLSQMARNGDEILITLNVNTLTQNQQNKLSFPTNPHYPQTSNPVISPSTGMMMMPQNFEIVAKGFARVQQEHPQPLSTNSYLPQQPSFPLRYPMPCYSNSGPPQVPIGPPIVPIFTPSTIMMPNGFDRPLNPADLTSSQRNYSDDYYNHSHINIGNCDYMCQSSLYQPDFRGRPYPGVTTNPYISHSPPPMNFSAKRSSRRYQSN